ncbi:MAG: hypothetical protein WBQ94_28045 [Terracidiphilus sp.]
MNENAANKTGTVPAPSGASVTRVIQQPDGLGKRAGKKGEITVIANLLPGGARIFRERLAQLQDEAWHYESMVGTVDNFRVFLFDNDTRMCATVVYDGDFKPYLQDIFSKAAEWLDRIFVGVVEGFEGSNAPGTVDFIKQNAIETDLFFVSNPDLSVRDIARMKRVSVAVSELLDAAS